MYSPKLIAAFLLATVLVVFGVQNTQSVTFHFFTLDVGPAPVIYAVFGGALVGALFVWVTGAPGRFRARRRRGELEHQIAAAKAETAAAVNETILVRRAGRPPAARPGGE